MTPPIRTLLALLTTAALAGAAPAAAADCREDQPCFNWAKMGDHTRGVTLTDGRHVVVGTCRFQRLHYDGRIDWAVTPHRPKGDRFAKRYGCGFDVLLY